MSKITYELNNSKGKMIDALLHMNLYKMPDGRQLYEATEKELESVLNMYASSEDFCSH